MDFDVFNSGREELIQYLKVCISIFVLNYDFFTDDELQSFDDFYNSIIV